NGIVQTAPVFTHSLAFTILRAGWGRGLRAPYRLRRRRTAVFAESGAPSAVPTPRSPARGKGEPSFIPGTKRPPTAPKNSPHAPHPTPAARTCPASRFRGLSRPLSRSAPSRFVFAPPRLRVPRLRGS